MTLFVTDPTLSFDKVAAVEVEDDASTWARKVLTELYLAVPEVSNYSAEVSFLKVDEEQGYGLGVVIVSNQTNSALAAVPTGKRQRALVPVIIKAHKLCPLDVVMTPQGHLYPLTPERLREALFKPEAFDLVTDDFGDTSLWNMFYPPGRADTSYGSGIAGSGSISMVQGPGMKMAGIGYEMLEAINGTYLAPDLLTLTKRFEDGALLKAASRNRPLLGALAHLDKVAGHSKVAAQGMAQQLSSMHPAQVVQLGYEEALGTYICKTANRDHGDIQIQRMSRGDFLKFAGPEITKRVDSEGTLTISEGVKEVAPIDNRHYEVITKPGIYEVRLATNNKPLIGWVLPGVVDGAGNKIPLSLFMNGESYALQDQIVGRRCVQGAHLPNSGESGFGCFYVDTAEGIEATVPLHVLGHESRDMGEEHVSVYQCRDFTGEDLEVQTVPGIKAVVSVRGTLMLPRSARFARLDDDTEVQLVSSLDGVKLAFRGATEGNDEVVSLSRLGEQYRLKCSSQYLEQAFSKPLGEDDALFFLCVAGLGVKEAAQKLVDSQWGSVTICGMPTFGAKMLDAEGARKSAARDVAAAHALRQDCVKEAAAMDSVATVDALLSLGFLNAENTRIFISRIPYLEKALSMLCELAVAARLGRSEIPESASIRGARALDTTVQGLKALALQELQE